MKMTDVPAAALMVPPAPEEIHELALRIQAEIHEEGRGCSQFVYEFNYWIGDPARRLWWRTFGRYKREMLMRHLQLGHDAKMLILRLDVDQAYRADEAPDDEVGS